MSEAKPEQTAIPVPVPTPEAKPVNSIKAIVVTDNCPFCAEVKGELSKAGLLDKIELINASTPEGLKFAQDHGITGVPECVVIDRGEGGQVKVCNREEFEKLLKEGK